MGIKRNVVKKRKWFKDKREEKRGWDTKWERVKKIRSMKSPMSCLPIGSSKHKESLKLLHPGYSEQRKLDLLNSIEWQETKKELFSKISKTCVKCRSNRNINVDHIVSVGVDPKRCLDITNLQVLCKSCNFEKGFLNCSDYRSPRIKVIINRLRNSYIGLWTKFFPHFQDVELNKRLEKESNENYRKASEELKLKKIISGIDINTLI